MSSTNCPNCGHKLKGGFLTSTAEPMDIHKVNVINECASEKKEGYCHSCGHTLLYDAINKLKKDIDNFKVVLFNDMQKMLTVSIPNPPNWNFSSLGIVTGQLVIGTGVLSELSQTFTDIVGGTSNTLKGKLQNGEKSCLTQLKHQTQLYGGNAIVGVNVSYAELGGAKGMVMVCMTGTAVKVHNLEEVTDNVTMPLSEIESIKNEIKRINKLIADADFTS